jgi:hypothetical protein
MMSNADGGGPIKDWGLVGQMAPAPYPVRWACGALLFLHLHVFAREYHIKADVSKMRLVRWYLGGIS